MQDKTKWADGFRTAPAAALAIVYGMTTALSAPLTIRRERRRSLSHAAPPASMFQKLGHATQSRSDGPVLWLNGTALGELVTARPIVEMILAQWPHVRLLVTKKNMPDLKLVAQAFPAGTAYQSAPVDIPSALRRFYGHWRPDFALWVNINPTPNHIFVGRRHLRGMAIVQATLPRSRFYRRCMMWPLFRAVYGAVDLIAARSPDDARRYAILGARNVMVRDDIRHFSPPLPFVPAALERLRAAIGGRPCWVFASARDDEFQIAARAHRTMAARHPGLLTIIVPRHPATGPATAQDLRTSGFRVARRAADEPLSGDVELYVADTLGELGLWYRLCRIAAVGGSFAPRGGHNVLEPARLGCAVLCGPSVQNIAQIAEAMTRDGALAKVEDERALIARVSALLSSPAACEQAGEAARAFADRFAREPADLFSALVPYLTAAFGPPPTRTRTHANAV